MVIPDDFGEPGGTPISNKDTILEEIDTSLNRKQPSVEYLVCLPWTQFKIPVLGIGISYNYYGHSAIRYKLPKEDGTYEDVIMNIEAKREPNLNNILKFYDAPDYLFDMTASEGGIYTRDILTVAYENVPDEKILEMHHYFEQVKDHSLTGHKQFDIMLGPIWNIFSQLFPRLSERGNCAKWTSEGLKKAGIIDSTHVWPKNIWITMFEDQKQKVKPTVVLYEKVQHCPKKYGIHDINISSYTAPFDWIRSFTYRNPKEYADCIVHVPENDYKAVVKVNHDPIKPSHIRDVMNSNIFIGTSVTVCGLISYRVSRKGLGVFRKVMYGTRYNRRKPANEP